MSQIIIKLKFSSIQVLKYLEKYIEFYNRFLASIHRTNFYIEVIDNGVVFIYKNMQVYRDRLKPFNKSEQAEFSTKKKYKDPFVLRMFIPEKIYPKEGLRFDYVVVSGDPTEIMPISVAFFNSITPDQQLVANDDSSGYILIKSYSGFIQYLRSMAWKYVARKK